jgi:hypothetical protein
VNTQIEPTGNSETILEKIQNTSKTEKVLSVISIIVIVLFLLGFMISFLISGIVELKPPTTVLFNVYNGETCSGAPIEGSETTRLNICESIFTGSRLYTFRKVSMGVREIILLTFTDKVCKSDPPARLVLTEGKCEKIAGKSFLVKLK